MFITEFLLLLVPLVLSSPVDQSQIAFSSVNPDLSEPYRHDAAGSPQKIAIIGSGIVGATAAYTLAENARQNSKASPISITIFEQNAVVGGRITTTKVFDQEELTIDTCAATFNAVLDTCVLRLAREIGLTTAAVTELDNGTAIWNGKQIVGLVEDTGFRDVNGIASNFKKARFRLRYALAPFVAGRMPTQQGYTTLGTSPFTSLDTEVSRGRLNDSLVRGACESGDAVLCNAQPESELYLREVIAAGVRDRFFGDYDEVNELNSVLGLTDENALLSVDGGNLRLIDRLIKISNAKLNLNTKVTGFKITASGKWNVFSDSMQTGRSDVEDFDKVIIAAPLSLSDLTGFPGAGILPRLQYADTVVTHFTTKWNLNASFFGTGLPVPQNILTSSTATSSGKKTEVPFFSLRLLDNFIRPVDSKPTDSSQKLYKIVSSKNISLTDITEYLEPTNVQDAREPAVSWMHREYLPRSVPRLDRAMKIQTQIEVGPGLFYAGGGAQVTDTVEFGCRMGTNVARLIVPQPVRQEPGNG